MELEIEFARGSQIAALKAALVVVADLAQTLEIHRERALSSQSCHLHFDGGAHLFRG